MLFPPIELLYLASIAREWHNIDVSLLDSIAENSSAMETIEKIRLSRADMIVCLTGFEIFEEDIDAIKDIRKNFPDSVIVLFGHYPTTFPMETLSKSSADFILHGEPDINFSNLLDYLSGKIEKQEMKGVYYINDTGSLSIHEGALRIKKPDELPIPAHDLLKNNLYYETFLPKPFGLIQSARGCPYTCNFCVRSYGKRLALRSPESMIEEIKLLVKLHQIKSLRFIDDTFTATSKRVIQFCRLLLESGIKIKWTCLSRADTLNEEMIRWMKKAGCVRVYIGVESGSPKILALINKQIDLEQGLLNTQLLHKYGIETTAFFMVGYPQESEDDFQSSMEYARKSNFDFVIPGQFTPYPGTPMFEDLKSNIDFNLYPYKNSFKNKDITSIGMEREKRFYKNYYFRLGYVRKVIKRLFAYPKETLRNSFNVTKYQLKKENYYTVRKDYM